MYVDMIVAQILSLMIEVANRCVTCACSFLYIYAYISYVIFHLDPVFHGVYRRRQIHPGMLTLLGTRP